MTLVTAGTSHVDRVPSQYKAAPHEVYPQGVEVTGSTAFARLEHARAVALYAVHTLVLEGTHVVSYGEQQPGLVLISHRPSTGQHIAAPLGDSYPLAQSLQVRLVGSGPGLENRPAGHVVHPVAFTAALGWLPAGQSPHVAPLVAVKVPFGHFKPGTAQEVHTPTPPALYCPAGHGTALAFTLPAGHM